MFLPNNFNLVDAIIIINLTGGSSKHYSIHLVNR